MKTNSTLFLLFFIMFITVSACSGPKAADPGLEAEKVNSISYTNKGGMMGFSENLDIRPDSVFYNSLTTTKDNEQKIVERKNTLEEWKQLTDSIPFADLIKIVSGGSLQPMDGMDQTYIIKTNYSEYTFTNPDFKLYPSRQVEQWTELIRKLAGECNEQSLKKESQ